MNQTQAIKRLRALLGNSVAWRTNPEALTAEEKESYLQASPILRGVVEGLKVAVDRRRREILAGDAEFNRLRDALKAAEEAKQSNSSRIMSYRVTVGRAGSLFFTVEAQGDNWEEVVAKVEAKKGKGGNK